MWKCVNVQISTYVLSGCDEQTAGDEDNDSGLEGGSKTIIGGDHLNSDADHHYDDVGGHSYSKSDLYIHIIQKREKLRYELVTLPISATVCVQAATFQFFTQTKK